MTSHSCQRSLWQSKWPWMQKPILTPSASSWRSSYESITQVKGLAWLAASWIRPTNSICYSLSLMPILASKTALQTFSRILGTRLPMDKLRFCAKRSMRRSMEFTWQVRASYAVLSLSGRTLARQTTSSSTMRRQVTACTWLCASSHHFRASSSCRSSPRSWSKRFPPSITMSRWLKWSTLMSTSLPTKARSAPSSLGKTLTTLTWLSASERA